MKPLGSLNLQGFFVFRIVQFSRYQVVIFIDPLHSASFLLYHIAYRLSRGFLNFFKVFKLPIRGIDRRLKQLIYHITFPSVCQALFQNFFFSCRFESFFRLSWRLIYSTTLASLCQHPDTSNPFNISCPFLCISSKAQGSAPDKPPDALLHTIIVSLKATPLRASLSALRSVC